GATEGGGGGEGKERGAGGCLHRSVVMRVRGSLDREVWRGGPRGSRLDGCALRLSLDCEPRHCWAAATALKERLTSPPASPYGQCPVATTCWGQADSFGPVLVVCDQGDRRNQGMVCMCGLDTRQRNNDDAGRAVRACGFAVGGSRTRVTRSTP